MSRQHASFHGALRFYPRAWREKHESDVVAILLDQAEAEGRQAPSFEDQVQLAREGLIVQFARASFVDFRSTLATVAVGTGAGISSIYVFAQWWPLHTSSFTGPVWQLLPMWIAWLAAFAASLLGQRQVCKALLVVAAACCFLPLTAHGLLAETSRPSAAATLAMLYVTLAALVGTPGRSAVVRLSMLAIAVAAAAWTILTVLGYASRGISPAPRWIFLTLLNGWPFGLMYGLVAVFLAVRPRVALALIVALVPWWIPGLQSLTARLELVPGAAVVSGGLLVLCGSGALSYLRWRRAEDVRAGDGANG